MTLGALHVVKPGLLTTVQDLGRVGYQAIGVSVAGAMDAYSHRLANALVGNAPDAATLEVTLLGPEFVLEAETTIAVAGADFDLWCDAQLVPMGQSIFVKPGQQIRFGRRRRGARAYVAVAGGIQVAPELGSRSTHLLSHMGGFCGRSLAAGDRIPILARGPAREARRLRGDIDLPVGDRAQIRVLAGPQTDWFDPEACRLLNEGEFRVSTHSDRMGYRLDGPRLVAARQDTLVSEAVGPGAIQVPAAGEPILLMADRQTTGGYPKIGHVISADLPVAGQLAPGDRIGFVWCTPADARAALIARERSFLRLTPFAEFA